MAKKIKPVSRIVRIEAEINKIAGEAFQQRDYFSLKENWVPCVDILERGDEIILEIDMPGIEQKDIDILLHSSRLEVRGQKRESRPDKGRSYIRLEREYGSFNRVIFLPCAVFQEEAKASLYNGVLTIVLKKYRPFSEKEVILKIQKSKKKAGEI